MDIDDRIGWIDRWKPLPVENYNCLPLNKLLALSNTPPSEWPIHATECDHCFGVLQILQDRRRTNESLGKILSDARTNVLEEADHTEVSFLSGLRAFFLLSGVRWSAALLIGTLTLSALLLLYITIRSHQGSGKEISLTFGPTFESRIQPLQAFYKSLMDGDTRNISKINADISRVNQSITAFKEDQAKLSKEQRAEFADLTARITALMNKRQEQVFQDNRRSKTQSQITNSQPALVPLNQDASKVQELYTAVGESLTKYRAASEGGKKTDQTVSETPAEKEQPIEVGVKNIRVVGVDPGFIEVKLLNSNLNPGELNAINNRIKSFKQLNKLEVKLINPGYSPDNKPVTSTSNRTGSPGLKPGRQ